MLTRILADVILAVAIVAGSYLCIFLDVIKESKSMTDENITVALLDSKEKWKKAITIAEICVIFLFLGILYFFIAS